MSLLTDLQALARDIKILYIEDDQFISTEMEKYLKKVFSNVDCAYDGLHGLEYYEKGKYNIFITDLSMPLMGCSIQCKKYRFGTSRYK